MSPTTTQPDRQHQSRAEAEPQRRRRRSEGKVHGQRLGVAMHRLDFNSYAYRWINDEPARLDAKLRHDDWDLVPNDDATKEDSVDLGNAVSYVVGAQRDGSPKRAYLCRKLKKYYEEDRADRMKALDEQLAQIMRGNARDGSAQADYVPHSGISQKVDAR